MSATACRPFIDKQFNPISIQFIIEWNLLNASNEWRPANERSEWIGEAMWAQRKQANGLCGAATCAAAMKSIELIQFISFAAKRSLNLFDWLNGMVQSNKWSGL